jgi:hypothetical protein
LADEAYHALQYSKDTVKQRAKNLLLNVLKESAQASNESLELYEASKVIDRVLNQAMNEDQRQIYLEQSKKYLEA